MNVRLYVLQRLSAALLAPLVLGHVAMILYATGHGLSAAEILGRTRGNVGWGLFYGVFVLAAALHAGIGVRQIAMEWGRLRGNALDVVMFGVAALVALLGLRAVYAVVLA